MNDGITVRAGTAVYPVLIGAGVLDRLPTLLAGEEPRLVALLADQGLPAREIQRLAGMIANAELDVVTVTLPAGEAAKDLEVAASVWDRLLAEGMDRTGAVVCLGGGATGDLGAFVASTFMRGVRCYQVPTTLLAMVDSSVGGKTGINRPGVKNAVGTFAQPAAVVADLEFLATLPRRVRDSAMAEVVKYAVAMDRPLYEFLLEHASALRDGDTALTAEMVQRCVSIKAEVVERDERESGERALLNYGHTAGHAIEAACAGALLHGESVAVGMRVAGRLSVATGLCDAEVVRAQESLLDAFGLPSTAPAGEAAVLAAMEYDKKARDGSPRWVLLKSLGEAVTGMRCAEDLVRRALRPALEG
ncbi:MAG: 3-dehydroquinate synthase [Candidatus Dormibacteria bacterium]